MKASVLVVGFLLVAFVPAYGHGGGGGGGHGGGHSGGHFGGHGSHFGRRHSGNAGSNTTGVLWKTASDSTVRRMEDPLVTTFVGFGSVPGLRVGLVADSFFCPLAPHLILPFCPVCTFSPFGVRPGFYGLSGFALVGDGGSWPGLDDASPQFAVTSPEFSGSGHKLPLLVFRNGWSFEVTDYGLDDAGNLRYTTSYGGVNIVALDTLDLYATVKANEDRGITFTLKMEHQP